MKQKRESIYVAIEHTVSVILIGVMVVVLTMQVLFRYVIRSPLFWSEELARFVQIWAVFVGATFAFRRGTHMNIDIISFILPKSVLDVADFVGRVILTVFFALITYIGWRFVARFWDIGSAAMEIPLGIVYFILPLTSAANIVCIWFPKASD